MAEEESLPEDLRCNRSDGRKWRCGRRVVDGKKLCEVHYLQGRHRQFRQKVPEGLKLERKNKKSEDSRNCRRDFNKEGKIGKMKRKRCVSEALDEVLKRMKLKKGDLPLELIRLFLKQQVEKKKERSSIQKELPYGSMEISSSGSYQDGGASSGLDVKLGSSPTLQRSFRTKNIEPIPIGTMQVVPFAAILKRAKRKKCHWCRKSGYRSLIKCSSCKKQVFCMDCILERSLGEQSIKVACPVCCGTCSCRVCRKIQTRIMNFKDSDKRKINRTQQLHYLIYMLLPMLKQINKEQNSELEIETRKGKAHSDIQIQEAQTSKDKIYCCNCTTSIVDYHRSCSNCSYKICLSCCWELRRGSFPGGSNYRGSYRCKTASNEDDQLLTTNQINDPKESTSGKNFVFSMTPSDWKACSSRVISCPSANLGGCGDSLLDLRRVFPFNWTNEVETVADKILCSYKAPETPDTSSCCSSCEEIGHNAAKHVPLKEVASRPVPSDKFLYCPTLKSLHVEKLEHFQKHWGKGDPIIVRNVLQNTSDLTWDPILMFCTYLGKKSCRLKSEKEALKKPNSLDWCEIEISAKQLFMGSLEWETHATMRQQMLKFRAWLSSGLFQEHFPEHYAEILRVLPLPEYTHPISGLLNVAAKLPPDMTKRDLGPCFHISYGGPEDLMHSDFLTKLSYDSYDVVNILACATDVPVSAEQLTKIKDLVKRYKGQDRKSSNNNSTNHIRKSCLHRGDTDYSGLHDVIEDGVPLPLGIPKVPFYSVDSLKSRLSCIDDGNMSHDSSYDSEFESEASIHCSDDSENEYSSDDLESFTSIAKKAATTCGAQWDIFRKQDVPKLIAYLRKHRNEFSSAYSYSEQVVHPVLDQKFFLDAFHKLKLKEELDVQPWTFEQHPGEAVFVPAGCPYQIRKLKPCVSIVLDFISPENAADCIRLNDELRLLPRKHRAKGNMLEAKTMTLHSISSAVEEIRSALQVE